MLKFFFWILLLANAVLLAYQQGTFDSLLSSGREPARMGQQINADKIRLIPPPEPEAEPADTAEPAPSAPAPSPEAPAAPAPSAAPAATGAASVPVATTPAVATAAVCAEIGNFNPEEAQRFSEQIAALSLGNRVSRRPVQEVASHMVYIPPQADRESAEKKATELRSLGVEDFFIIQDNSAMRWGISLGVFKQEEAARTHLAGLNKKGVRSARIGQRKVTTSLVAFRLQGLDGEARTALEKLKADYPKKELRVCDAT